MSKGKIKEYDPARGYGSIVDSQTGQILSVYANYIELKKGQTLMPGQEVEFDIESKRSEDWAIHVKIL